MKELDFNDYSTNYRDNDLFEERKRQIEKETFNKLLDKVTDGVENTMSSEDLDYLEDTDDQ